MQWQSKKLPKVDEWRIRKRFCFLPKIDKDGVWHWFEYIGVVDICEEIYERNSCFGLKKYPYWKRNFLIDVELIDNTKKIAGKYLFKG